VNPYLAPTLGLIAPDLQGPPSGGTLYNANLFAALRRAGAACSHWELASGRRALARGAAQVFFVDSLYLDALPALREQARPGALHLLLHYLPSLVTYGREIERAELSGTEREALEAADGFLVTSTFMRGALERLQVGERPVLYVEPGVALPGGAPSASTTTLRAVMLCNVVAGKGVLRLLSELAAGIVDRDRFELSIAGRLDLEPAYAEACRAQIAAHAGLRARVRLLGPLPHTLALTRLAGADLLLSTSRMESYGMALSEARAAGVPIIARTGGHAQAHVERAAGGTLVADEAAVATRLLELARSPELFAQRRLMARAAVRARSWEQAAGDLIAQLERIWIAQQRQP
jgi:glycosyltransferase involved in cell wall biosynthesis